jgi:hypothetical protein
MEKKKPEVKGDFTSGFRTAATTNEGDQSSLRTMLLTYATPESLL